MIQSIWQWLSKTKNQKTLAWIGGSILAAALAWKQVFPNKTPQTPAQPPAAAPAVIPSPPASAASATSMTQPAKTVVQQKATSGDGGISVNASGNASVVIGK